MTMRRRRRRRRQRRRNDDDDDDDDDDDEDHHHHHHHHHRHSHYHHNDHHHHHHAMQLLHRHPQLCLRHSRRAPWNLDLGDGKHTWRVPCAWRICPLLDPIKCRVSEAEARCLPDLSPLVRPCRLARPLLFLLSRFLLHKPAPVTLTKPGPGDAAGEVQAECHPAKYWIFPQIQLLVIAMTIIRLGVMFLVLLSHVLLKHWIFAAYPRDFESF